MWCWFTKKDMINANDQENADGSPAKQIGEFQYTPATFVGSNGDYHYFRESSTTVGWSGAPVIDNDTSMVVGIHTGVTSYNGQTCNRAAKIGCVALNTKPTGPAQTQ